MSESLDCILYGLEEAGLLDSKMEADNYSEEFINMRATATRQPQDTVFGDFIPTNGTTTSNRLVVFGPITFHILCRLAFAIIK
jgi:hypothetical protein